MTIDLDRMSGADLAQAIERTETRLAAIGEIRNLLSDAIEIAKREADDGSLFERLLDSLTEMNDEADDVRIELDNDLSELRTETEMRERGYYDDEEDETCD